jgi:hypothetical protein
LSGDFARRPQDAWADGGANADGNSKAHT